MSAMLVENSDGRGRYPSIDTVFDPSTAPGLLTSPDYLHAEATAAIDWRESEGYTRSGGYYAVTVHRYDDRSDDRYTFNEVEADVRQFIPLVNEHWVIALRGQVRTTDLDSGQQVPYFLLPSLGGSTTLRGYPDGRFRDRHALLLSGEYPMDSGADSRHGALRRCRQGRGAARGSRFRGSQDLLRHRRAVSRASGNGSADGSGARARRVPIPFRVRQELLSEDIMHRSHIANDRRIPGLVTGLVCTVVIVAAVLADTDGLLSSSPRFYDDDPMVREVDTKDASAVQEKTINLIYHHTKHLFDTPGDEEDRRALNVNTIDEVPESSWFVDRILSRSGQSMTVEDVARGPGAGRGPAPGPWIVVSGKRQGATPGFTVLDANSERWFIKFDPPNYPEMASGAEVVVTKLFHAIGYHVPENAVAVVRREDLVLTRRVNHRRDERFRPTHARGRCGRDASSGSQAAGRVVSSAREQSTARPTGWAGFCITGHGLTTRTMSCRMSTGASCGRSGSSRPGSITTTSSPSTRSTRWSATRTGSLSATISIDFGSTLGSGAVRPRRFDHGHQYMVEPRSLLTNALSLGFHVRPFERVDYPDLPSVGRFSADRFDPARWKPEIPNPAFLRARADDLFWGARRVMAFTDEMIGAVVASASYGDERAARHITETLIARRDRDWPRVADGREPDRRPFVRRRGSCRSGTPLLTPAVASPPQGYRATWFSFDNATGETAHLGDTTAVDERMASPDAVATMTARFLRVDVAAVEGAPRIVDRSRQHLLQAERGRRSLAPGRTRAAAGRPGATGVCSPLAAGHARHAEEKEEGFTRGNSEPGT